MLALSTSKAVPLDPRAMSRFGTSPWLRTAYTPSTLHGCGCDPVNGCQCAKGFQGLHGLHAGHGGGSHSGMGRSSISYAGFRGLGQGSLDSIIQSAANWLGGWAQSQLPASASVPPQYGSYGALSTQLQQWLPWIIGGYLLYRVIK